MRFYAGEGAWRRCLGHEFGGCGNGDLGMILRKVLNGIEDWSLI